MKTILILFAFSIFSLNVSFSQNWQTNIKDAKHLAVTNNQNIVLVFQGSDWCAPCIKLDKEIWSTSAFKTLAKNRFVMLQADFPKRKKNKLPEQQQEHNNALAKKYNPNGYFPYVVVINANGKFLGSTGYKKTTPELFFKTLTAFEN